MLKIKERLSWVILISLLALVLMYLVGCASSEKEDSQTAGEDAAKLRVGVSIVPQASLVEAVGGDLVEVITMIPPGASPENYAPTPQIMGELSQAQVYFAIGVPAERDGILPRLAQEYSEMKVVDLASRVDQIYPALEMAPGETDPHRWMSPLRVQEMVKIIAGELAALDPENADTYQSNAAAFQDELMQLDTEIRDSLAQVQGKSFIVYHPAMGYFASDYGLNMIALEEEGKEAAPGRLEEVIDQAKKENIKVIFYQAEMDSKQARTLAQELGGKAELIAPLAPDYIDNLSKIALTFAQVLQEQ